MKIYILDAQGASDKQFPKWLSADKRVEVLEIFQDYIKFIERIGNSPPDLCFIRVGGDRIPGLKTAEMVRQISQDISIVFISDKKDYALDAYEIGIYGYLLCPVKRDKLEKYLIMKREM